MKATGSPEGQRRGDPGRAFLYSGNSSVAPSPPVRAPEADAARTPPCAPSAGHQQGRPTAGERRASAAGRSPSMAPPSDAGPVAGSWASTTAAVSPAAPPGGGVADRWARAIDNLEDARKAADVLVRTVDDAVYMDEESYNQAAGVHQYTRTIQAQQVRVRDLSAEVRRLQNELSAEQSARINAEHLIEEKNAELGNNAVVFKMHYEELLSKDDEIRKLQAMLSAMS